MPTINQLVRKSRKSMQEKSEARRLHACLHDNAEKAELGSA